MIKKLIRKIRHDHFFKDNAILFISLSLLNLLGYLFHFYIGRALGPEDYSIVGALLSMIYLFLVPFNTLQTGITNFVARFKIKEEYGKIAYLFKKTLKKMFFTGLVVAGIFALVVPRLAIFLNMGEASMPLYILAGFIFISLLLPVNRGLLQGLQKFKGLGFNYILEGVTKLGSALILIPLGFGVNGAITCFVLSFFIPFFLAFFILKRWFKEKQEKFNTNEIYKFSFPVLIMLTGMTLFYTLDVILVKHFFDALSAGYYSAVSLLAKVLFFGTLSISVVLFPKVTELHTENKASRKLLTNSIGLTLLFCVPITIFYFMFPGFVIKLLFGNEYLAASNLVGIFALTMTLFSVNYLMSFYAVATGKRKFIFFVFLFALLMVIGIWLIHNTLMNVILLMLFLNILLFILLAIISYKKKNE